LDKGDDPIYHAYTVLDRCVERYNANNRELTINRYSASNIEDLINLFQDNLGHYFGMEEEWSLRVIKRFEEDPPYSDEEEEGVVIIILEPSQRVGIVRQVIQRGGYV